LKDDKQPLSWDFHYGEVMEEVEGKQAVSNRLTASNDSPPCFCFTGIWLALPSNGRLRAADEVQGERASF